MAPSPNPQREIQEEAGRTGPDLEEAVRQLREIAESLSAPNWDGYGANPVQPESVVQAERFLRALPEDIPMPSIGADPDGEVALDWEDDGHAFFSVSVSPDGLLTFAGQAGPRSALRGREEFRNQIPFEVLGGIRKVTGWPTSAGASGRS